MTLLGQKPIQEELQLSESQVELVQQLAGKRREARMEFPRMNPDARNATLQDLAEQEKKLLDNLEVKQKDRFKQLALQQRGVAAFSESDVSEALQLSSEQKETIRTIIEEGNKARSNPQRNFRYPPEPPRRPEDDLKKVLAVLSGDQLAKWNELIGKPIKIETPFAGSRFGPGFGPGFGSPRDPRPPTRQ
jgi:hypothetical protein